MCLRENRARSSAGGGGLEQGPQGQPGLPSHRKSLSTGRLDEVMGGSNSKGPSLAPLRNLGRQVATALSAAHLDDFI